MTAPGRKGISYEEVVQACRELEAQNDPVTIRKVAGITGGSFSTVSGHIRKWQEAVNVIKNAPLPDALISSLQDALYKLRENDRKIHLAEITRERKNLDETLKEVVELEGRCDTLYKTKEDLDQHYRNLVAGYEKKLAAAESRVTDSERREKELNAKLEELREKLHQSQIQIAVAETKCGEYEKQLAALAKETKR